MNRVDWRYVDTRIARAIHALDEIADRLGDEWHDYDWDDLSSARQLLREFVPAEVAESANSQASPL